MRPTREQMEAVERRIERLQDAGFACNEGGDPRATPDGPGPRRDDQDRWGDLDAAERRAVLAADVDWSGFTAGQKDGVIERVVDEIGPDLWMAGVDSARPRERMDAAYLDRWGEEFLVRHGRSATDEELAREGDRLRESRADRPEPPEAPTITDAEIDRMWPKPGSAPASFDDLLREYAEAGKRQQQLDMDRGLDR